MIIPQPDLTVHAKLPPVQNQADHRRLTEDALAEFLPVDERRRDEAAIWLEFTTASRVHPSYRPYVHEISHGMWAVVEQILKGLGRRHALHEGVDIRVETDRLCALLDGLAVRGITSGSLPPAQARTVLTRHLDTLLRSP